MKRQHTHNVAIAALSFYLMIFLIALFIHALFQDVINLEHALCGAFALVSLSMWFRVFLRADKRDRDKAGQ